MTWNELPLDLQIVIVLLTFGALMSIYTGVRGLLELDMTELDSRDEDEEEE